MAEEPKEVQVLAEEVYNALREGATFDLADSDLEETYFLPGWDVDTHSLTLIAAQVDEGMEWLRSSYTFLLRKGEGETVLGYSNEKGQVRIPWLSLEVWRSPETKMVFREGVEITPLTP